MQFAAQSYILFTADIQRLAEFYERAFGFKRVKNPHFPESGWIELKVGPGFKLCLHRSSKPGSSQGNPNKLVFRVADVAAAREHLVAAGVKMGKQHHWPGGDACDGRDPEGNKFQLAGPATPA